MIHVDSVSVTVETASLNQTALSNVNLAIGDGNLVVVLGPGGSEKSMLLNVIGGLLSPTSGEVSLDGEPIKSPAAARHVVFHGEALLPWHNVEQSVEHRLRRAGVPQKALPQRTRRCSRPPN